MWTEVWRAARPQARARARAAGADWRSIAEAVSAERGVGDRRPGRRGRHLPCTCVLHKCVRLKTIVFTVLTTISVCYVFSMLYL